MPRRFSPPAVLLLALLFTAAPAPADTKKAAPAKPAAKAEKIKAAKSAPKTPAKSESKPDSKKTETKPAAKADGSSLERAIVIREDDTIKGIAAENRWIRDRYPGWRTAAKEIVRSKTNIYDKITLQSPTGEKREVYFEISRFFGRINGRLLQ